MAESRCAICPNEYRCVQGDGPTPNEYMSIGERPGFEEESGGRPFIGQSGREFNENYLGLAGLDREDIYVTNAVKCFALQNRKPSAKEVEVCGNHHLPDEISLVRPSVVFLMGATACSLVPDISLEVEHGVPRLGELFGHDCWLVPINHPASGLHDTSMMIPMLDDWEKIGEWLGSGEWVWPEDKFPKRDYRLARTRKEVAEYFLTYGDFGMLTGDSESHDGQPYSVQVSVYPGTGIMVLLEDTGALETLSEWINNALHLGWSFGMHQELADLGIFESAGTGLNRPDDHRWTYLFDTMKWAYLFGNKPQGLKALAFRLFGVRMKSWEDLVTGPSREKLTEWLVSAVMHEKDSPVVERKQLKTKVKETVKPNPTEKFLTHLLKHIDKPTYDPWDRLLDPEKLDKVTLQRLEMTLGETVPRLGIKHVPLAEQVYYGCQDADMTLRTALEFKALEKRIVAPGGEWFVYPEDYDK